ncbi:MAG: thiamine pyrophosphate-binding protein [Lachnospiraceae bacterium]|nr:thiamine pyrophosphate-binding protein [Lachnospiraceae bacterium]
MRQKVSDYIADFLAENDIHEVFTVPGGLAMHMNDSFGHHSRLRCTYQHHEQACAMAAEAYARVAGKPAAVCVTAGPGATNAITGALGGWMGSVPMLILSGQTRYATGVEVTGLRLRSRGIQECDIVSIVRPITKYAQLVRRPEQIRYELERALHAARTGRPGPAWLDIPLDVQGASVDTEALSAYEPEEDPDLLLPEIPESVVDEIANRLTMAKRPILFPGNGIRLADAHKEFLQLVDLLGVPVVTGVSSVDAIPWANPLFTGRCGGTGDRAGNFAVQNSDLFLSIGCRQSFSQTGFKTESWAREAFTIMVDADPSEIRKPNLHVSLPVVGDAGAFIRALLREVKRRGASKDAPLSGAEEWRTRCRGWRERYPVVTEEHYKVLDAGRTNTYAFYNELTKAFPEDSVLIASCGTSRVIGSQVWQPKAGQRFITNSNMASMGFDLPAIVGASRAVGGEQVVCVTGEGSLMMNLQELQTLRQNGILFKLFVVNNEGYHSVRMTQSGFFKTSLVGVGEESGDLSFPDLKKLVPAFGFRYTSCGDPDGLAAKIREVLDAAEPTVCQIFVTKQQKTLPKTSSRKLEDGSMVSAPLEDMFPFLSREELRENMIIPLDPGSLG